MLSKVGKLKILVQTNLMPGEARLPHRCPSSLEPHVVDGAMGLLRVSFRKALPPLVRALTP